MESTLFKLQFIYHNYSSKTLFVKIFFLATIMALIPCFDLGYHHSWTFQKSNLQMNISELHSVFELLITENWLNQSHKTLTVGRGSVKAVMELRKIGYHDAIGVDRKRCSSMVKRGSIYDLGFKKNSFDLVLSMAMIDGVRVPARMVQEMERVLKPERVGVVLRRVSGGPVPRRDVMKEAAPVGSYLKLSSIVGVRTVNCTVMVIFRKRNVLGVEQIKPGEVTSDVLLSTQ